MLDWGAIGLAESGAVLVSDAFSAVGDVGRGLNLLYVRGLRPRLETSPPETLNDRKRNLQDLWWQMRTASSWEPMVN